MGLLVLGLLNLQELVEVMHWTADRLLRWANAAFALFGIAGCFAVPVAQAFLFATALAVQAVAGWRTIGPPRRGVPTTPSLM